jgi:hypothetical protein
MRKKTALTLTLTAIALAASFEVPIRNELMGQTTEVLHNVKKIVWNGKGENIPAYATSIEGITFSDENGNPHKVYNASLHENAKEGDTLITTTYTRNTVMAFSLHLIHALLDLPVLGDRYEARMARIHLLGDEVVNYDLHPAR